jgi:hypothetical protein
VREVEDVAFAEGGFVGFERYADEADDAAGGDQSRGERASRARFRFRPSAVAAGFFDGLIDEPADHAAAKDGQRGADGEIGADGELSERMPSSSTAMTRKTPIRTSPQGSLRVRMPLMTVAMRRACGAGGFSLPMP